MEGSGTCVQGKAKAAQCFINGGVDPRAQEGCPTWRPPLQCHFSSGSHTFQGMGRQLECAVRRELEQRDSGNQLSGLLWSMCCPKKPGIRPPLLPPCKYLSYI